MGGARIVTAGFARTPGRHMDGWRGTGSVVWVAVGGDSLVVVELMAWVCW